MTTVAAQTTPFWKSTARLPTFSRLDADVAADVVIVGAGISGLTAAYLLARAGASVVVLERGRVGASDTGHTSAHLTMVLDERLSTLVDRFGVDHARAAWDAGVAAIAQIETIVEREAIDCDFTRVDGYLHAPIDAADSDIDALNKEAALARDLGFGAQFIDSVPLANVAGIQMPQQARIHPVKYLAGLLVAMERLGVRVFEQSSVDEFTEKPKGVTANGQRVVSDFVYVATHTPLLGSRSTASGTLFQTKLSLYSTYVVAARVEPGSCPDALMWDTASPYHYYRLQPMADHDVVIYGGEDHKTGQADRATRCFDAVEAHLHRLVGTDAKVFQRWSGQVIETHDALPYIGLQAEGEFSSTGYAGNGLTLGTLAGMMARDQWQDRKNPWRTLFDPSRKPGVMQAWDYIRENADYPYYMVRDLFVGPEAQSLRGIQRGEGKVVKRRGESVAASRDSRGRLVLRSAVCTHMGCLVAWNDAERTWDCPCHGSRFKPDGQVIAGPAESPLPPIETA